jgi:hypothetical protein
MGKTTKPLLARIERTYVVVNGVGKCSAVLFGVVVDHHPQFQLLSPLLRNARANHAAAIWKILLRHVTPTLAILPQPWPSSNPSCEQVAYAIGNAAKNKGSGITQNAQLSWQNMAEAIAKH